jgi:hypothetical protein
LATPFHRKYLNLVEQIERRFPVAHWKSADVEIWPLARMDLYLDMYWANVGGSPPEMRPFPLRRAARIAAPLRYLWNSRHDLSHWVGRPKPAHAIFLGDGVSLDRLDGETHDRFGEPIIAALERRGLSTFLMQNSDLSRLPWHRPTYPANIIASRGVLGHFATLLPAEMPAHDEVLQFLAYHGVDAPSLTWTKLARRASTVFSTAAAFERVLRVVKPKLAFVVTYYSGLGPAFLLACRRQGILSIDLQHCPQEGAHKAYGWSALPDNGYATLPAVFWNWTEREATDIRRWSNTLTAPWHRSLHGGHTQLGSFLNDRDSGTTMWDEKFNAIGTGAAFEREILVALQPVGGFRAEWDALAAQIESGPTNWRWWIRRHPASAGYQDAEYRRLVSLRRPNVMVDESLSLPLPALLRHMSVVVSRFSGSSVEAAAFGVPAIFLSEEARGQFADLIDRGLAAVIDIAHLDASMARLPRRPVRPTAVLQPNLEEALQQLEQFAEDYSKLCSSGIQIDSQASR